MLNQCSYTEGPKYMSCFHKGTMVSEFHRLNVNRKENDGGLPIHFINMSPTHVCTRDNLSIEMGLG